jgi:hypothetical protein
MRYVNLHLGQYGYWKFTGMPTHRCKFKKLVAKGIACEVIVGSGSSVVNVKGHVRHFVVGDKKSSPEIVQS